MKYTVYINYIFQNSPFSEILKAFTRYQDAKRYAKFRLSIIDKNNTNITGISILGYEEIKL